MNIFLYYEKYDPPHGVENETHLRAGGGIRKEIFYSDQGGINNILLIIF